MTLVRCAYCPGATTAIVRVSRRLCPSCRRRQFTCPKCRARVIVDDQAETIDGQTAVAFCTRCDFALELPKGTLR